MSKPFAHFDLMTRLVGLPSFELLTCLDLGCGSYESEVAKQVLEIPWLSLTSVDCYASDVEKAMHKPKKATEWLWSVQDVRMLGAMPQFDVVLAFDVLEHLPKTDGLKWLVELNKIARKRIVLFLPIEPDGFHRKTPDPANPAQEHVSHWKPHELEALQFKVEVVNDIHTEYQEDGKRITYSGMWATKNL